MMSAREKEMARILARRYRVRRFEAVIAQVSSEASAILDLGCGIGALTNMLAERFPSAVIVGLDRSKFLLRRLQRQRIASTVLGEVSALPFRDGFFDATVAVQVLHEIVSTKGDRVLVETLQNIRKTMSQGGEFVIFDHCSPTGDPVLVRFSKERLGELREFQAKFRHRKIAFEDHGEGLVRISRRDFYDFLTKIWALGSDLEEEEMNETHTPFTRRELEGVLQEAGFSVERIAGLTSVGSRKGITLQSKERLPKRHILVLAKNDPRALFGSK